MLRISLGCPHCCKEVQVSLTVHHPKESDYIKDGQAEQIECSETVPKIPANEKIQSFRSSVGIKNCIDIDPTPVGSDVEDIIIHEESQENTANYETPPLIFKNEVDEEHEDSFIEASDDDENSQLDVSGPSLLQHAEPMAFKKRTIPQILHSKTFKKGTVNKPYISGIRKLKYPTAVQALTPLCNIRSGITSRGYYQQNYQNKAFQHHCSSEDDNNDIDYGDTQGFADDIMNTGYDDSGGLSPDQHLQDAVVSCHLCNVTFDSWNAVREHVKAVHFSKKPFICAECGKALSSKYGLEYHMMTHSKQRNKKIPCALCNQTFYNEICLKTHIRSRHSNMSPGMEIKKEFFLPIGD